jgi:hypothetical protein
MVWMIDIKSRRISSYGFNANPVAVLSVLAVGSADIHPETV